MKKLLLFFLLFPFTFSLCLAQDTIALLDGTKIIAKDVKINNRVFYHFIGDSTGVWYSANKETIDYIHYAKGKKTVFDKTDIGGKKNKSVLGKNGPLILGAGLGYYPIPQPNGIYNQTQINSVSPLMVFSVDWALALRYTVGATGIYRSIRYTGNGFFGGTPFQGFARFFYIGAKVEYEFSIFQNNDAYLGAGAVLPAFEDENFNPQGLQLFSYYLFAAGYRHTFFHGLGLNAELTLSAAYFGCIGIYYML